MHIMAMIFMFCDHLWGTIVPGNDWLTCIGRITFPVYAFLIVEGYFHTKSLRKYVLRLLVFAVISEIPFNLAMGSSVFYPIHQNVLWSFLIAIGLIHWNEKARATQKVWKQIIVGCVTVVLGYLVGLLTMVDYYHAGILTALAFYFFRERKWWGFLGQLICLWYINVELLGGFTYEIRIGEETLYLIRQSFALLALIPIWLYSGRKGKSSKALQYGFYAFYPVHMLLLSLPRLLW